MFELELSDVPSHGEVALRVLKTGFVTAEVQLRLDATAHDHVVELQPGFSCVLVSENQDVLLSQSSYCIATSGAVIDGVINIRPESVTRVGGSRVRLSLPLWKAPNDATIFLLRPDGLRCGILEEEVRAEVRLLLNEIAATVRVVDTTGLPLKDAFVGLLPHPRGRALSRAQVRVAIDSSFGAFGRAHSATTNERGTVELRGFIACQGDEFATIIAECDGYVGNSVTRSLRNSSRIDEIILGRHLSWLARGRVTDVAGQPIAGVRVIERPNTIPVCTTNVAGQYEIPFATVHDGYWLVTFDASGYASRSENIPVPVTEQAITYDTTLFRSDSVSGAVIGSDGAPVERAMVSAYGIDGTPYFGQTETDLSGRFMLENVAEGVLVLMVIPPKARRTEFEGSWRGAVGAAERPVTIVLPVARRNRLRVVGVGTDGSSISLDDSYVEEVRDDGGAPRVMAAKMENGVALFENVPYQFGRVWVMSRAIGVASVDLPGAVGVNTEVSVTMGRFGAIRGRVVTSASPAGFRIRIVGLGDVGFPSERGWELFVSDGGLFEQTTGSDGSFDFSRVPFGKWRVISEKLDLVAETTIVIDEQTRESVELHPKEMGSLSIKVSNGWIGSEVKLVALPQDGGEIRSRVGLLGTSDVVELRCPAGRNAWRLEYSRKEPSGALTVLGTREGFAEVRGGHPALIELDLSGIASAR